MNLSPDLQAHLFRRIREYIEAQDRGDVDALHEFIDPDLRAFEQVENLTSFAELVQSARCEEISLEEFTEDGGPIRRNRPTAFVRVTVVYNDRHRIVGRRRPWVLHDGEWYTRAVGWVLPPGSPQ